MLNTPINQPVTLLWSFSTLLCYGDKEVHGSYATKFGVHFELCGVHANKSIPWYNLSQDCAVF